MVVVFFGLLYRMAISSTTTEIARTRAFVATLPVHVLSREVIVEIILHNSKLGTNLLLRRMRSK